MEKKEILEKVRRILERCANNELKFGTSANWRSEVYIYEDTGTSPAFIIQLIDSLACQPVEESPNKGKLSLVATKNNSDILVELDYEEVIEIKFLINKVNKTGGKNLIDSISKFL